MILKEGQMLPFGNLFVTLQPEKCRYAPMNRKLVNKIYNN